jgi:MFS family permease
MQEKPYSPQSTPPAYGWVIVAVCGFMVFITYGLIYSYSVFFKPLAEAFHWDRATISLIYSLSVIIRGAAAIGSGWLADKYGPRKVLVVCGLLMGAGYLLSSQVATLWQFFLTYAVVEAFGMSGIFAIGNTLVARWFVRNRGLALGLMGSGSSLGTLIIVPSAERLINTVRWSETFIIIGFVAGALMIIGAFFLRNPAPSVNASAEKPASTGASIGEALRDSRLYLVMLSFLFFFCGIQIIMVHLVNYATDIGIDPFVAATVVGVIGLVSIGGRVSIGVISDRIGIYLSLILMCVFLAFSFVLLLFIHAPWEFYVYAVIFSVPYGGEVTQIALVLGHYFGTRSLATLMGMTLFVIGLGGALGPWLAGKIFDMTHSYHWAFIFGALVAAASLIAVIILKRLGAGHIEPDSPPLTK